MKEDTYTNLNDLMINKGRLIKARRRQVIQTTDTQTSLNLVKSGYIKRYLIRNDGSLSTDLIYGPGDVFSLLLVFRTLYDREILDSPEIYYYEAITDDVELYALNTEELKKGVGASPILYKDLLDQAGQRMTYETHGLENIAMKDAYKRVAHQLAYYGRRFGKNEGKKKVIMPPLTHQDIADLLSLTRETVSNCMVRLRRNGFVSVKGRQIVVNSMEKLNEEAFG